MVPKNHQNPHCLSIPADWTLPKFYFNQQVQIQRLLPKTTGIQTGKIVGIEYLKAESYWVTKYSLKVGWHYSIEVDADDPCYCLNPFLYVAESDIEEVKEAIEVVP